MKILNFRKISMKIEIFEIFLEKIIIFKKKIYKKDIFYKNGIFQKYSIKIDILKI